MLIHLLKTFLIFLTYLQEVPFNTTFYESPVVILSVNHQYDRQIKGSRLPGNNIISAWVEVGLHCYYVWLMIRIMDFFCALLNHLCISLLEERPHLQIQVTSHSFGRGIEVLRSVF